jgi:hypothetical protein
MNTYPGIIALVRRVVREATIDRDAPCVPRDERVSYPIEPMAQLFKSITSPERLNAAIGACHDELEYQLMGRSDIDHALAAMLLRQRLEAPPSRGYIEGIDGLLKPRWRHRVGWLPVSHTNRRERVNQEIKRRTDVVGVFPNPAALLRLAGSVRVETHDEWQVPDRC